MEFQVILPFKIENKILIGEETIIEDNIGELILNAFKSRPDFIGQVDARTGEENTFQQMRERSVKCALWMKNLGVGRNDIVTICTSNHLDTYIPYLATLYVGAILGVWHEINISDLLTLFQYLGERLKIIFLDDIDKASTILAEIKKMNISTKIVIFEKESKELGNEEEEFETVTSILNGNFEETEINAFSCTELESNRDTVAILFSSNSRDVIPKHVTISQAFLTSPSNYQLPIMSPNDVGLWVESLHWNVSLILTVRAILSYVKAVKISNLLDLSQECFCNTIQEYKVTWVFLKYSMAVKYFYFFEDFRNYDLSSLKQMIFDGKIRGSVYRKFVRALPNTSVAFLYCLPETGVTIICQKNYGYKNYVNKTVRLMFVNCISKLPQDANNIGIIWCKSPCLTNGYFDLTTGNSIPAVDDNGWFHLDIVGYYDKSGYIYIWALDRDIMKCKGHCFLTRDIENVLKRHPHVKDAAITYRSNALDGHHPLAFVVRKKGSEVTEKELIEFVAKKLDDSMHLRAGVRFVNYLPYYDGYLDRATFNSWTLFKPHNKKEKL
ncbi:luciferin 4-monooxygenase-like [Anoplolepis gracilipes]|uniref:luciferin 4-monooxygenase-like n=1 Tax=Anoplolepis gracilipes TaxID=354296 RepID=UPI003BA0CC67